MDGLQRIKTCPNPDCTAKHKVYLNGKTHCDACHTALVRSSVGFTQSSIDLLQSMSAVQTEMEELVQKREK